MKKRLGIATLLLLCITATVSAKQRFFGFDAGIGTGGVLYTNGSTGFDASAHRFIIGTLADVFIQPTAHLRFFTGTDIFCDFVWEGDDYAHHLDCAFLFGVKLYPWERLGVAFSVAYALGSRTDFTKYNGIKDTQNTAWGNGFKIGAEYDFAHGDKSKYLPALGGFIRWTPRGRNQYDTLFGLYITIGL